MVKIKGAVILKQDMRKVVPLAGGSRSYLHRSTCPGLLGHIYRCEIDWSMTSRYNSYQNENKRIWWYLYLEVDNTERGVKWAMDLCIYKEEK